jgi:hypothetical protein
MARNKNDSCIVTLALEWLVLLSSLADVEEETSSLEANETGGSIIATFSNA